MVDVVNKLTGTSPHIKRLSDDTEKVQSCCIMADPGNFEAVAAAFVISDLINLHFMRSLTSQTVVMMQGDNVPDNTLYAVVPCMALPVFADEDFQVPGHDLYMHLASNPHLRDMAPVLAMTIRAVFEEIGIMCLVQMASQEELDLRARQIVTRFTQKPPLPLPSKLGNRKPPAHFNTEALEVVEIHPQHPGLADHYNLEHNEEMIPADLVGLLLALFLPRKWVLYIYFIGLAVSCLLFSSPREEFMLAGYYGCKFFPQTGSIALFVLIAESFAAPVRATGTAVVLGVGRLGASLAPVVYEALTNSFHTYLAFFYTSAFLMLACFACTSWVPETAPRGSSTRSEAALLREDLKASHGTMEKEA
eukprot:g23650.t1